MPEVLSAAGEAATPSISRGIKAAKEKKYEYYFIHEVHVSNEHYE